MSRHDFAGTRALTRLALRRDRIRLPAWVLGITCLVMGIVKSYGDIGAAERLSIVTMAAESPGMRLMVSPIASHSVTDPGAFLLFRASFLIAIMIGLMSIGIVVRHTRQNEETGCAELLGSAVTGRFAKLGAALSLAVSTNLVLSVLLTATFIWGRMPLAGSLAAGLSMGAFGIAMSSIAALTAQLSSSSRGASGLASAALGGVFLINALGNALGTVNPGGLGYASAWPVWLSPLGWVQQVMPFNQNNFWILLLFAALSGVLIRASLKLVTVRDVGRGILAAKPGPATAKQSLLSPLGVAWRLQRGAMLGWAVSILAVAVLFGGASQSYGNAITDVEIFARLEASAEHFRFMQISVIAVIVSMFTMQALLRKHAEEDGGPLEAVLATPVSRARWMVSHIACGILGSVLLLLLFGVGLSLSSGATGNEAAELIRSSVFHVAPVMVVGGLVVIAYGLLPRLARALSGTAVLVSMVAGPFLGPLLSLPKSLMQISPFSHVAMIPTNVSTTNIVALLALAAILFGAGVAGFAHRNLSL